LAVRQEALVAEAAALATAGAAVAGATATVTRIAASAGRARATRAAPASNTVLKPIDPSCSSAWCGRSPEGST
jgi:hypothetical protein